MGPIVLMYRLDDIVVDVELERVPCLQPVVLDGVDGLLLRVALLVGAAKRSRKPDERRCQRECDKPASDGE